MAEIKYTPATQGLAMALGNIHPQLANELKDVVADQAFFSMVQARAKRVQEEAAGGKMRLRLRSADVEMQALMLQALADLTAARAELSDATKQAELDALVAKAKAFMDSVVPFLTANKSTS